MAWDVLNKQAWREELARRWAALWPEPGPADRPPMFPGVGRAAERLRRQPEYQRARTLAVMPDPLLLQVRINALQDGKTLIAVTPGLKQGLVRFTAQDLPLARRSHDLRGGALFGAGRPIRLPQGKLGRVDLLVGAALAVDASGLLLGDGRGLLDLTYALLRTAGALGPQAPVAVVLDEAQIVEALPQDPWDVGAALALTPGQALRFTQPARPDPVLDQLPPRLADLPVVKAVRSLKSGRV